jgi:hypothetical protein
MTELDPGDVKWFVRKLHEKYEERSLIHKWFSVDAFIEKEIRRGRELALLEWENNEEEVPYNQIGEWTKIPISIIESTNEADAILDNLVKRVTFGERNYMISNFHKKGSSGEIPTIETGGHLSMSEFGDITSNIKSPDHLVLPIRDDLREMRREWRKSNNYHFMNEEYIIIRGNVIQIHWYSVDDDNASGNGYLFNSNSIHVTQKWHGDSVIPDEFEADPQFEEMSKNRPFMLHFGNETIVDDGEENENMEEKIDFLYRSILSEPDIDSGGLLEFRI